MAKQVYIPIKSCLLKQIAALVYKSIYRKVDLKVESYLNALEGLLKQKVLVPAYRDSDSGMSQRSLTDPEKFHSLWPLGEPFLSSILWELLEYTVLQTLRSIVLNTMSLFKFCFLSVVIWMGNALYRLIYLDICSLDVGTVWRVYWIFMK